MINYFKKNKVLIPFISYLFFSLITLALIAIPKSLYEILSLGSTLTNASDNMPLALTSMLAILLVVCLPVQVILAFLGLFSKKLYLARVEAILNMVIYSLSFITFTLIIILGSMSKIDSTALFTPANYVVYIVYLVGYALFIVSSIFFIFKPYKVVKQEAKEKERLEEETKQKEKEEERQQYRSELKDMDKEKMKEYLLEKKNQGLLSEEKYQEFMSSLDEK